MSRGVIYFCLSDDWIFGLLLDLLRPIHLACLRFILLKIKIKLIFLQGEKRETLTATMILLERVCGSHSCSFSTKKYDLLLEPCKGSYKRVNII